MHTYRGMLTRETWYNIFKNKKVRLSKEKKGGVFMPRLKDLLTKDETDQVDSLRNKLRNAETIKEANTYKSQIDQILEDAKARYYMNSSKNEPRNPENLKAINDEEGN